ncbi:MAG: hypothetical protein H0V17_00585 [Deltaproteobacteria bacterium]|nr:hypothetical protein [Deltaproteobacteria bacterium]
MESHESTLYRCTDRCREVFRAPVGVKGGGALLDDGRWIFAASRDGVAEIWVEDRQPQFFRLPSSDDVRGVAVLEGKAALIVTSGGNVALVPVPEPASR